jgi:alpha-galactosidase
MISLTDRKTGENLYPEVLARADRFFEQEPGYSDLYDSYRRTGSLAAAEKFDKGETNLKSAYTWADRKLVQFMLKNYKLLPITTDSHFGEYLSWAWDVVDHRGILDFYDVYKVMLSQEVPHEIRLETSERVIPIIDGIITDAKSEEAAVNILNTGLIDDLPSWLVVEVPAMIDKNGITGIRMGQLPKGYLALLCSYAGVYDMTAEAIIHKSKEYAIQALLANPVVHQASSLEELVDRMISKQERWLGYLK